MTYQWIDFRLGSNSRPLCTHRRVNWRQSSQLLTHTTSVRCVLSGKYLQPQFTYVQRQNRMLPPQVPFPNGWDIGHSDNHSTVTMKRYIDKIIVPFIRRKMEALKLPPWDNPGSVHICKLTFLHRQPWLCGEGGVCSWTSQATFLFFARFLHA